MSILIALLAAAVGCVAAGIVAGLAVSWYRIGSFEGKSSYFVISIALVGLVAGLVIGLIVSRVVAGSANPGALRALWMSQLAVVAIAGIIAGIARTRADVPPRIGGQELLLVVEVRWPARQRESPARDTTVRRVNLYATSGRVTRVNHEGPLWTEDARQVDGRWVATGAVELFTSRGERLVLIEPAPPGMLGFTLPLPAFPRRAQLAWSEWMSRARPGAPPLPDGFTLRYKVLPRTQPVRTQTFGDFDVMMLAHSFTAYSTPAGGSALATRAEYTVRYRGVPVHIDHVDDNTDSATGHHPPARFDRVGEVAVLPGARALLVLAAAPGESGPVYLLAGGSAQLRTELVTGSARTLRAPVLTTDAERFARERDARLTAGWIDQTTFASSGSYLFEGALLITDPASVRRFAAPLTVLINVNVPPLGLSPDGRSIVRVAFPHDGTKGEVLVVTDAVTGTSTILPIDQKRLRVGTTRALDPRWLTHYFAWERGADGVDRLAIRQRVTPMPYQGFTTTTIDGYHEYHVQPAGQPMLDALKSFLAVEFGATRTPADESAYGYQARVGDQVVHLLANERDSSVAVFMELNTDTHLVATIGARFNAALATGKYDRLFMPW